MSVVGDLVQGVVESALRDILKKATGTTRRRRRRKRTLSASVRLDRIEKLIKPAKRQVSRRKTVRARSKAIGAGTEGDIVSCRRHL